MTSSFFSALMWIKEAQDKDSGKWNDYDYTCVSAAQLSVVGSDLVTDNLERAVQYIKSSQYTPGIFSSDTGGGEPTLTSTCLAILGLYSSGQRLNRDELKKNLDFLEDRSSTNWDEVYDVYTTLAALEAMENGKERLGKQGAKVRQRAVDWVKAEGNWELGAVIENKSARPRDRWRATAVALLALKMANERHDSLLVRPAIAGLNPNPPREGVGLAS